MTSSTWFLCGINQLYTALGLFRYPTSSTTFATLLHELIRNRTERYTLDDFDLWCGPLCSFVCECNRDQRVIIEERLYYNSKYRIKLPKLTSPNAYKIQPIKYFVCMLLLLCTTPHRWQWRFNAMRSAKQNKQNAQTEGDNVNNDHLAWHRSLLYLLHNDQLINCDVMSAQIA
jgi:hypothetical protein